MIRSKQSKKREGGFVSKKAANIAETFKNKKAELSQVAENEQVELPYDNDIYLETVKGPDKKCRVFGLGNATSLVFNHVPGTEKKGKGNLFTNVLCSLSSENEYLKTRLTAMEERERLRDEQERLRDERDKEKQKEEAERMKKMDLCFLTILHRTRVLIKAIVA